MNRLLLAGVVAALATSVSYAEPIIGGTAVSSTDFPAVVAIEVGNGLCTGTLITKDWVMTAAHCVTPGVVGESDQASLTASIRVHFGTGNVFQNEGTVVEASDSIPNPLFNVNALGKSDIGLIKLKTPVVNVTPTPVNLDPTKVTIGLSVTQVGYGATTGNPPSGAGRLFSVTQNTVSCGIIGGGGFSDTNLICFNQSSGMGQCEGDSGGPSFTSIAGKQVQIGITSFGDQSCAQFGADTRTDAEQQFLLMHVPELQCSVDSDCLGMDQICFHHECIAQPFGPDGIGSSCMNGTECDSGQCASGPGGMKCTELCTPGAADACPDGFECMAAGGTQGACWPTSTGGGGCCDAGTGGAPTMLFGIAIVALGVRRRKR